MPDAPHDTPSASVAGARWADALASSHRASDALAGAAASFGRLDQALASHPLRPAFLYRARLEAVRQQAAVDGEAIDPWHLAALLEGLRLRMDHGLRIIDRGLIFAAGRHALTLHQWLTEPDCDQEGEVRRAEAALAGHAERMTPLLAGARACHAWLDQGGERAPMRAALVRLWVRHRVLRTPVPLTGTAALRAETDWEPESWVPAFLTALAGEAEDARQLLSDLERAWFAARRAVAGRRRHSRAAAAIDIMAATPLVSATSLAAGLGMAVKNAAALLDGFCQAGLAVEVTHRSKRRLFGLAGLAPLRDGVAAPRRPEPGRGRGRPPAMPADADLPPPAPSVPLGSARSSDANSTTAGSQRRWHSRTRPSAGRGKTSPPSTPGRPPKRRAASCQPSPCWRRCAPRRPHPARAAGEGSDGGASPRANATSSSMISARIGLFPTATIWSQDYDRH